MFINKVHKLMTIILVIGICIFFLYNFFLLPKFEENKTRRENQEKIKLNSLISCIENAHKETLQEFYKLCGMNNDKNCPFLNALNASIEGKYSQKKDQCLKSFYNRF